MPLPPPPRAVRSWVDFQEEFAEIGIPPPGFRLSDWAIGGVVILAVWIFGFLAFYFSQVFDEMELGIRLWVVGGTSLAIALGGGIYLGYMIFQKGRKRTFLSVSSEGVWIQNQTLRRPRQWEFSVEEID